MLRLLEGEKRLHDPLDVDRGELAVLLPEVLSQRREPPTGVDQLDLALAILRLPVGQNPDVGRDAGVVEHVKWQLADGFYPVILQNPPADVALALAGVAGEERRARVDLGDATPEWGIALHLR